MQNENGNVLVMHRRFLLLVKNLRAGLFILNKTRNLLCR
jgi:hypothetical protein